MNIIERHREQLEKICEVHTLLLDDEVLSTRRNKYIQKGRAECYAYLRNIWYNYQWIAEAFWMKSHSGVLYAIKTHFPFKEKLKNVN